MTIGPPKHIQIFITSPLFPLLSVPLSKFLLLWISPVRSNIISCINLNVAPTCDTETQTNTELTQIFIKVLHLPSGSIVSQINVSTQVNKPDSCFLQYLMLVIGHSNLTRRNVEWIYHIPLYLTIRLGRFLWDHDCVAPIEAKFKCKI